MSQQVCQAVSVDSWFQTSSGRNNYHSPQKTNIYRISTWQFCWGLQQGKIESKIGNKTWKSPKLKPEIQRRVGLHHSHENIFFQPLRDVAVELLFVILILFHGGFMVFVKERRWKKNKNKVSSGSGFFLSCRGFPPTPHFISVCDEASVFVIEGEKDEWVRSSGKIEGVLVGDSF